MCSSSHPSVDIKFDFVPFSGTPGETYDKWERALLNAGARADERGYSDLRSPPGVDEARPPIRTCPAPERMAGNHVKLKGNDRKTPTPYSHDIYMPQNTLGNMAALQWVRFQRPTPTP